MLVKKYSKQQMYTVRETADVYKRVTKAQYLDSLDMSHCDWMYNVLDNKKEQELTVFENEHYRRISSSMRETCPRFTYLQSLQQEPSSLSETFPPTTCPC